MARLNRPVDLVPSRGPVRIGGRLLVVAVLTLGVGLLTIAVAVLAST